MLSDLKSSAGTAASDKNDSHNLLGYLAIGSLVLAITAYAIVLNIVFYRHNGPFYDSLSYYNHLNWLMSMIRHGNVAEALHASIDNSTVFLPWLQAMLIAPIVPPSRPVGIVIQALWLLVLGLALFHYLKVCKKLNVILAVAFTMPFIAPARVFEFSGGLSDFRMDLIQYLLLSITSVLFLTASESNLKRYWILSGLFAGFSCLGRSTSLVYLILTFIPLAVVKLFLAHTERKKVLQGVLLMIVVGVISGGWYYIANQPYLHYYYVLWNPHANAKLPLAKSARHLIFAALNLGKPWIAFGLVAFVHQFGIAAKKRTNILSQINWRYLWIGLVPCSFLVLLGAGPNPFVSMPSILGLGLFLLLPTNVLTQLKTRTAIGYLIAALAASLITGKGAMSMHRRGLPEQIASMPGLIGVENAIIDDINKDMKPNDLRFRSVASIYCLSINNRAIINTLLFDQGFRLSPDKRMTRGSVRILVDESLEYDAPLDWASLKGSSNDDKVNTLGDRFLATDYLIVPSQEAVSYVEHNPIATMNLYVGTLRADLLAHSELEAIAGPFALSPYESVVVYRNNHPHPHRPLSAYTQPADAKGK